jgi:hypothetical protein
MRTAFSFEQNQDAMQRLPAIEADAKGWRPTLPVPAREAGRDSTRGSEHAEDRNDRP